jgi:hypothetical protein
MQEFSSALSPCKDFEATRFSPIVAPILSGQRGPRILPVYWRRTEDIQRTTRR